MDLDEIERRLRELETEFAYWRGSFSGISSRDTALRQWAPVIIATIAIIVSAALSWLMAGGP